MQQASALFRDILSGPYSVETKVTIGDEEYGTDMLISLEIISSLFGQEMAIGKVPCAEIQIEMLKPQKPIPRMAVLQPYIRVTDGERNSEWIPKGTFYLDVRTDNDTTEKRGFATTKLTGYDSIIFLEGDCPSDGLEFPAKDIDIVQRIAESINIEVEPETLSAINNGYTIPSVDYYSGREILGYIAGAYAGSFIITAENKLRLVTMNNLPRKENYLLTSDRKHIIRIGGVRIRVD